MVGVGRKEWDDRAHDQLGVVNSSALIAALGTLTAIGTVGLNAATRQVPMAENLLVGALIAAAVSAVIGIFVGLHRVLEFKRAGDYHSTIGFIGGNPEREKKGEIATSTAARTWTILTFQLALWLVSLACLVAGIWMVLVSPLKP